MRTSFLAASVSGVLLLAGLAYAGPYSGPTQTSGDVPDPAIPSNDARFVEWADTILPLGAGTYFAPRGSTEISTTGFNSLGDLSADEIAAGDSPGFLTVSFPTGIRNGPGHDFAVFENGFVFPQDPFLFMELAYVEVSTDGQAFARFPSVSLNTNWQGPFGQAYAGFDSTNVFNLAGKHANGFGTPFNLADLSADPLVTANVVNLDNIQFVRLVDIPGNGAFLDSLGNPILDNWLTTGGTGGFDFRLPAGQGIGVINAIPEPAGLALLAGGGLMLLRRKRLPCGAKRLAGVASVGVLMGTGIASAQTVVDFEELAPVNPDYPTNAGFASKGAEFTGAPFAGWVAADGTDTTTPGFLNQYSAFPGGGAGGSAVFAIASGDGSPVNLPEGQFAVSAQVTNTTYAALSMRDGDAFAKKFGGPDGTDPDLFTVTLSGFSGVNGTGTPVGSPVEIILGDFRDNRAFILDQWINVDLTPLGQARSFTLTFFSTDTGPFGINTPTYLALDNLVLVPEPGTALVGVLGAGLLTLRRRRA